MNWNYRCEVCNCTLDPGEGRICVECKEKYDKSTKIKVPLVLVHGEDQYAFDFKRIYKGHGGKEVVL